MNALELRQALVEQSGMRGLVTDAPGGDYSDKSGLSTNATYYLNSGLRWLNRRWGTRNTMQRYVTAIASGQFSVTVPRIDFPKRVDISDGTDRWRLQYKPFDWMRDTYAEPWENVDTGRPLYWTWGIPQRVRRSPAEDSFLRNSESTDWTYSSASWSDGSIVFAGAGSATQATWAEARQEFAITATYGAQATGANEVWVWRFDQPLAGNDAVYIVGHSTAAVDLVEAIEAGNTITSFVRPATTQWGVPFTFPVSLAEAPTSLSFEKATGTAETVSGIYFLPAENQEDTDDADTADTAEISNDRQMIFMPRSDATYTIQMFGDFNTADLVEDEDENWWTVRVPELVIRAARIQLEIDGHRNVSGLEAFQAQVEGELARMLAEDRHAYISAMTPTEACRNG